MLDIKLSSLIFALMFTLLEARASIFKQPHHAGPLLETKSIAPQIDKKTESEKAIHQTTVTKVMKPRVVPGEEQECNNKRQLSLKGGLKKVQVKAKEVAKTSINYKRRKISGATPCLWSYRNRKLGKSKVGVTLCNEQRVETSTNKAKLPVGFVPLSADYHFPNSHPPRHN